MGPEVRDLKHAVSPQFPSSAISVQTDVHGANHSLANSIVCNLEYMVCYVQLRFGPIPPSIARNIMLSDPRATKYSHSTVLLLCAFCFLGLPPAARADSATYTYTGNAFTNCYNAYAGKCTHETISITLTAPLGDNLNATQVSSSVTSFVFSDGSGLNVNPSNAGFGSFFVSTDPFGNITQWWAQAGFCLDPSCSTVDFVETLSGLFEGTPISGSLDFATVNFPAGNPCTTSAPSFDPAACVFLDTAFVGNNPGTWSTPEPSTLLMLGFGLIIGLLLLGFRLNTHAF